jgi:hypothetical protein
MVPVNTKKAPNINTALDKLKRKSATGSEMFQIDTLNFLGFVLVCIVAVAAIMSAMSLTWQSWRRLKIHRDESAK